MATTSRPLVSLLLAARRALMAGVAVVLAAAVVAVPASAADPRTVDVPGQPLGVAAGPDGTLYVSDYRYDGSVLVYRPGETAPSRTINPGHFPTSMAVTPDGTLIMTSGLKRRTRATLFRTYLSIASVMR